MSDKYNLHHMLIGETVFKAVPCRRLTSTAAMLKTRKGLCFSVKAQPDGCLVTRLPNTSAKHSTTLRSLQLRVLNLEAIVSHLQKQTNV